MQQLESGGFHLHCNNIRELARQMLTLRASRGCNMPYRDGCPGHNWLAGFLKRHPGNLIAKVARLAVVCSFKVSLCFSRLLLLLENVYMS